MTTKRKMKFDPNSLVPDNGNYFGFPIDAEDAALVLVSAPWDTTVATRAGSSYAPDAIIEASRFVDFHEPMAPNSWHKAIRVEFHLSLGCHSSKF